MQIKSNWMIAVITGLLQSSSFLWACLVFPGIWLSQALAAAIHRSLWKQRHNSFASHPLSCLAAEMLRVSKNFQTAVARFFARDVVIGRVVFLLRWFGPAAHFNIRRILSSLGFCCHCMYACELSHRGVWENFKNGVRLCILSICF